MTIGGSLLESYLVCKRQAWLAYHAIQGDMDNDYLRQGTYLHEEAYKRQQSKNGLEGKHLDTVQSKEGKVIIGEVKKSSRCIESARMQLAYYLYQLKEEGIEATGVLQFPEEKRKEEVKLTGQMELELLQCLEQIETLVEKELPPKEKWIKCCEHCSYCESCWA